MVWPVKLLLGNAKAVKMTACQDIPAAFHVTFIKLLFLDHRAIIWADVKFSIQLNLLFVTM